MPWVLTALHAHDEQPIGLPTSGPETVTIGRRPENHIILKHLAVSGQHCLLHVPKDVSAELPPELEDCSTNGTYVNEVKLCRGTRQQLQLGDVISLTKAAEEGVDAPELLRIQFRVSYQSEEVAAGGAVSAADVVDGSEDAASPLLQPGPSEQQQQQAPPPPADANAGTAVRSTGQEASRATNFAQDLLVKEQQEKSKLTSQLLLSQRKLDEERHSIETMAGELKKLKEQLDTERRHRCDTEEARDRLTAEAETLRAERRRLSELRTFHEELVKRHETVGQEVQTLRSRCCQLEATTERLRRESETATAARQKASQQQAEISTRARQCQERAERLEQAHVEARREAQRSQEEGAALEKDLVAEKTLRQRLEAEVAESKERAAKAETAERAAQEQLDMAMARKAELECRAAAAESEADTARSSCAQAKQKLASMLQATERLRTVAGDFSKDLRRRAEAWQSAVQSADFTGVDEKSRAAPLSSLSATHRQEDTQDEASDAKQKPTASAASAPEVPERDTPHDSNSQPPSKAAENAPERPPAADSEPAAVEDSREEDQADEVVGAAPAATLAGGGAAAATLAAVILTDDLQGPPAGASPGHKAGTPDEFMLPDAVPVGTAACSTAWSLELVEDPVPAAKRQRL
eukprot:TRINITY_DN35447_c0_g1_i1.p1 TRINITY_DN35447_c0_g1~~TRINITY_DN35447_c0_g1_i1.p1  ORF type:complete len:640 (+),score=214.26 TRINITY_DN35447_c0_g1_i1:90-2009(+)